MIHLARVSGCLLAVAALAGCSSKSDRSDRIDDDSGDLKFPMVLEGSTDRGDPSVVMVDVGRGACTGSVIGARFVLTAAHCVPNANARVAVLTQKKRIPGVRVHLPPNATFGGRHDLAVVELGESLGVPALPVNLDASAVERSMQVRLVGYGITGTDRSDSGIKRSGEARVTRSDAYLTSVPGTGGTCYGDSGGPALARIGGRETIVGVTSHGLTRRCETGTNFVRTDTHRAFLARFTGGGEVEPEPMPTPTPIEPTPVNPPPSFDPAFEPELPRNRPRPSNDRPIDTAGVSITTDEHGCNVIRVPGLTVRTCRGSLEP